jgi:hypothetical protein
VIPGVFSCLCFAGNPAECDARVYRTTIAFTLIKPKDPEP